MADLQIPAGKLDLKGPQSPTSTTVWSQATSALTWAGLALTLAIGIGIPAGTLEFKGPAKPTTSIEMPAGAISLQGRQARIAESNIPVSGLSLLGYAPTVSATSGNAPALGVGAITWQGLAFTVRVGDLGIAIPAGQLVIKGPARPAITAQIPAATLAYQGRVPGVSVDIPGSAIGIPVGTLAYTGAVPDRIASQGLSIPAGTLAITGQYTGVAFSPFQAGGLVWQGLIPSIGGTQVITPTPGAGAIGYTGRALTCHLSVAMPAGSLVLDTPDMEVTATGVIPIPAAQLVFTGTATDQHLVWNIPAGSLVFTGQTPQAGPTAAPDAGSLVWQGYAPDIAGDRLLALPVGAVAYAGRVTTVVQSVLIVPEIAGRGSFSRRIRGRGAWHTHVRGKGSV